MPNNGYFLHKKSLLDRFKDDYSSHTGYIQSTRAEHTWNNPLTRRKRTKKLNGWIKSFAGKRHIRKLSRFNAVNAGRDESLQVVHPEVEFDCLRYAGILELPNGVCVDVYPTIRCPRRCAFVFRVMGFGEVDKDLHKNAGNLKYAIHGYYPVYGLERQPSEEFDIFCNDISELQKWSNNNGWGMGVGPSASSMELAREVAKSRETLSESTDEKLGYEKGHKNSRGEDAPWVIRSHKDNRILASFAKKKDAEEHMQRMKQYSKDESKKSEEKDRLAGYKPYSFKVKSKDPTVLKNDAEAVLTEFAEDVADNTSFKFDYDWYDKSWELTDTKTNQVFSKGTFLFKDFAESPLYLDDGVLAKPAGMKLRTWIAVSDADESKKSESETSSAEQAFKNAADTCGVSDKITITTNGDKVYCIMEMDEDKYGIDHYKWGFDTTTNNLEWYGDESTSGVGAKKKFDNFNDLKSWLIKDIKALFKTHRYESKDLSGYTSDVISELDTVWGCGEDGATRIAKKYADVIQQNYVDGDLLASETAKFIAGQEHLTESHKKSESKKSEIHLELVDTIIVPKWLWEAHVFGKEYGEDLDEHEQEILAQFEEDYGRKYTLDDRDEETDFHSRNDFDAYGGPCYEIDVYEES